VRILRKESSPLAVRRKEPSPLVDHDQIFCRT